MAIPKQAELNKKHEFKMSLMKKLKITNVFDTKESRLPEKQMLTILRSSVRKSWMQSPVRLLKLELARLPDLDPKTRTKWYCHCEHCKNKFKMDDVEVDHISGEHPLLTLGDIEKFARSILDVTLDDLQIFCKTCHDIKTYAERYDMTFEEATIEKKVVEWQKTTKSTKQKEFLSAEGFSDDEISNNDKRRDAYRSFLNRGESQVN